MTAVYADDHHKSPATHTAKQRQRHNQTNLVSAQFSAQQTCALRQNRLTINSQTTTNVRPDNTHRAMSWINALDVNNVQT